jgi:tRNA G18 (ribose-2'-O)-methylase SpoU
MDQVQSSIDFFNDNSYTLGEGIESYVLGVNLRSPDNVGALIRLADNIGAKKAFFIGDEGDYRPRKIGRKASSAGKSMNWEITNLEEVKKQIPEDFTWLAIETAKGATNLYKTELPKKVVFIAGNESFGLDDEFLPNCDQLVYIPMPGHTVSMNVSQATAVTIFEWYRQMMFK